MKKIVFLYSEIGPYNIPVLREIYQQFGYEIHIISWDENCLKPYVPSDEAGIYFYKRSNFDFKSLGHFLNKINPTLIYISGWMDKLYLKFTIAYKKKGVPIISGFDDMWTGSFKQHIGRFVFMIYLKRFFTHAWVAGERQFEYARKLGFKPSEIIFDLLSADVEKFKNIEYTNHNKTFLYVGNFRDVKGTDILIKAYEFYRKQLNGKWNLICIGNGPLLTQLNLCESIDVFDYKTQDELLDFIKKSSCFILPSRHDQWGVVVHEFACSSLPMILSTNVGSKSKFLIDNYNGFSFESGNYRDLAHKMLQMSMLQPNALDDFSDNSINLSRRITPKTSAANLMSTIKYGK